MRQLVAPTPDGLGISARGVTVSTVGLVPRMQQLATEGLPVTLALSLHAPDDELREAMSEKGLGTPATRAAIIEGLIYEQYIIRNGRELQSGSG